MIAIVNPMHEQREILKRRGIRKKKKKRLLSHIFLKVSSMVGREVNIRIHINIMLL